MVSGMMESGGDPGQIVTRNGQEGTLPIVFISFGVITAFATGIATLATGHSWWVALGAYAGIGMLTVITLAAAHLAAGALAPFFTRLGGTHITPVSRGN
jgi:hypothetical protein